MSDLRDLVGTVIGLAGVLILVVGLWCLVITSPVIPELCFSILKGWKSFRTLPLASQACLWGVLMMIVGMVLSKKV